MYLRSSFLLASAAVLGLTGAATPTSKAANDSGSASASAAPASTATIVPGSIPQSERSSWCLAQTNSCSQVCFGTSANTCDPTTLNYACTCSNGTTPDMALYQQTIPFYECQAYIAQCVAANTASAAGQNQCIATQCGTLNATEALPSTHSSSSSSKAPGATSTGSPSASSSGSSTSSPPKSSSGASSGLDLAREFGLTAVFASFLAGFGLLV